MKTTVCESHARRARGAWLLVPLLSAAMVVGPAASVRADYIEPKKVLSVSTDSRWLADALTSGVKAGVESVAKQVLSSLASALLSAYLPGLGSLLGLGGSDPLAAHVQRIIAEIHLTHGDLAERHRDLLDEVADEHEADLVSLLRTAIDSLEAWQANDTLAARVGSREVVLQAMTSFERVRITIEEYISRGATPTFMFRRMNLLPVHITAARMAALSARYYWGMVAIDTAFRARYGTDYTQFERWRAREAVPASIEAANPSFAVHRNLIYDGVLEFYETLAAANPVPAFIDQKLTPVVFQSDTFRPSADLYDNPGVVTSVASWRTDGGRGDAFFGIARPGVVLDGMRWYYYFNIPQVPGPNCLRGFAYDALADRSALPWVEIAGQPAASECNRFWILQPSLRSTRWPASSYLASFAAYSLWFRDPLLIQPLHREMLQGDLLRVIYGPVSLILDAIHQERHGSARSRNPWDAVLKEYDRKVALLGVASSYGEGRTWESALAAKEALVLERVTDQTVGLRCWFEALRRVVGGEHPRAAADRARSCRNESLRCVGPACEAVRPEPSPFGCLRAGQCGVGQGPCRSSAECQPGLRCQLDVQRGHNTCQRLSFGFGP